MYGPQLWNIRELVDTLEPPKETDKPSQKTKQERRERSFVLVLVAFLDQLLK